MYGECDAIQNASGFILRAKAGEVEVEREGEREGERERGG